MVKFINKAIFLDRDGTIIKDKKYLSMPEQVEFINGVDIALKKFLLNNYKLIVISNQSGIGRGYFNIEDVEKVNDHIRQELLNHSIPITAFYYCPHYVGSLSKTYNIKCDCRKPSTGMIIRAAKEHEIVLSESFMIGDKESDVLTGLNAGLKNSYRIDKKHNLIFYANLICNDKLKLNIINK